MRWFRIERVTWTEQVLWVALIGAAVAPLALRPSAEEVVGRYLEALDRGDVDGALRFTAEEFAVLPVLGGGYLHHEGARSLLEHRAALRERWRVIEWRPRSRSGEATAVIQMSNDLTSTLGVRPRLVVFFRVKGSRLAAEYTLDDDGSLRRALRPFIEWAEVQRPRELSRVWERDRPIRSAAAARRFVALLRDWRAAGTPVAAPAEPAHR